MDAGQDLWDWEVLPDKRSFSMGHGSMHLNDQETEEHVLPPSGDAAVADEPDVECKDIGVVLDETKPVPSVADLMVSDKDEEEKAFESSDAKEADDYKFAEEEEEDVKTENKKARPECVVFSVGKLKVNGIGALCSFGFAAATVCIFLIGGRLQHHHRQQQQKIQLQFYGDDKRIQQVVQQTSRLNQAMSSVMGAGGASTRANISFGGFYDGF
ncbi:uncharacterized protein C2845_PM04G05550 [Panicum miliaceum]|uniref:DUF6821 domain-containing protein n=1 Tax=Panicum miliaceum TaxID=4540 RepID=A0A3L6QNX2_PANMI|nr:uncharacterized protein C2845_PM04G05550 [Panicum miliaceum]